MNQLTQIEQSIFRTIAYFDIFSYPLTEMEVWKWQYDEAQSAKRKAQNFELIKIVETLESSEVLKRLLGSKDGVFFLKGRGEIVDERKSRYVLSDHKLKRAKFWIRFLQYAPFVRGIGICNSLGFHDARKESDIDLFIITEPHRVWTARLFVTGFLKIFRLRPSQAHSQDGICPSFFASQSALNMEPHALTPSDPYLVFWTTQIIPMVNRGGAFNRFEQDNAWIHRILPAVFIEREHPRLAVSSIGLVRIFQSLLEAALRLVPKSEKGAQSFQKRIMPENLARLSNVRGSGVFVSEDVLKFHEHDRRSEFREQFEKRLARAAENI